MHERIFDVSCISISCINRISLPQEDRIYVKHRAQVQVDILKIFDEVFLSLILNFLQNFSNFSTVKSKKQQRNRSWLSSKFFN